MIYTISIDWLSLFCLYPSASSDWRPVTGDASTFDAPYPWRYRVADYGTRQFKILTFVDMPNEQGGWDDFAEVQSAPASKVLNARGVVVRFVNRVLYRPDMWDLVEKFLKDNSFDFHSISRVDICGDFNQFETIAPAELIRQFAAKKLRHVGRGIGALSFNHGIFKDIRTGAKDYGVNYTGLSFGTHASDCRVYLYDKSFELLTQGDKPWIRDRWRAVGLDPRAVWRLEVSIKGKACKFRDRLSGADITITPTDMADSSAYLAKIYHTFVQKLFAFVVNRRGITNISREPRIRLFSLHPIFVRHVLRNVSGSSRIEKMIIKALYTIGDNYRGAEMDDMQTLAQTFAVGIADACDLNEWMSRKSDEWKVKTHK